MCQPNGTLISSLEGEKSSIIFSMYFLCKFEKKKTIFEGTFWASGESQSKVNTRILFDRKFGEE